MTCSAKLSSMIGSLRWCTTGLSLAWASWVDRWVSMASIISVRFGIIRICSPQSGHLMYRFEVGVEGVSSLGFIGLTVIGLIVWFWDKRVHNMRV